MSEMMRRQREAQQDLARLLVQRRQVTKPKLDDGEYEQNTAHLDDEFFMDIEQDTGKGDSK